MNQNKKVVIIGSGIGGLFCGIKLLHAGYEVEIFEKEDKVGGAASSQKACMENLHFDQCASIVIEPDMYKKVFYEVGLNPDDFFSFISLDVLYKVFFYNKKTYSIYNELSLQKQNFEQTFHEPFYKYEKFIKDLIQIYSTANKYFLEESFIELKKSNLFSFRLLKNIFAVKPYETASFLIGRYIKNKEFQKILLFQCLYMGISPYKLIGTYAIIPAVAQDKGIYHIKGGMGAYTEGLKQAFEALGGKIHLSSPVEYITMKENKANGVIVNKKQILGDYVISNADYSYTMRNLLKGKKGLVKWKKKCTNYKYTCSVFMLKLCFKKKFDSLNVHNIYINKEFKKEINYIFKGRLPKSPPLYIYYPSCIDDSFANGDFSCMNIMIRVPNLSYKNIHWNEKNISLLRSICLKNLKEITKCTELEKLIVYEECLTPTMLKNKFNFTNGAAFGIAPTLFQNLIFRPQLTIPTIKNLYFVGSSIHPGNGVSIVMKNAEQVAEYIIKNEN